VDSIWENFMQGLMKIAKEQKTGPVGSSGVKKTKQRRTDKRTREKLQNNIGGHPGPNGRYISGKYSLKNPPKPTKTKQRVVNGLKADHMIQPKDSKK
jgi:hypothetical protein